MLEAAEILKKIDERIAELERRKAHLITRDPQVRGGLAHRIEETASLIQENHDLKRWIEQREDEELRKMATAMAPTGRPAGIHKKPRPTGTHCGIDGCGEAQFETPSGVVCKNGHGGAPALEDQLTGE